MRHYVEVIEFKEGIFTRRYPPFFTKDAFTVFEKAIDQFKDKEAIVTVRDSNHVLIKAWGNVR